MTHPTTLVLRPLGGPDLVRWGVVAVVVSAALAGASWWLLGAGPLPLVVPVVALAVLVWTLLRRVEVDAARGTVAVRRAGLGRTVALRDSEWVHLAEVGNGVMALLLRPASGPVVRVGVLVVGSFAEDSRTPAELRVLADAVAGHARTDDPVAEVLRLQADHLAGGGDVESSPLASVVLRPRTRHGSGEGTSSALARLLD